MQELNVLVPYTAWGQGDEWEEGYEALLGDFAEAVEGAGLGVVDDPDHDGDYIRFYLLGATSTPFAAWHVRSSSDMG